jgi:anthranilate synthase component I
MTLLQTDTVRLRLCIGLGLAHAFYPRPSEFICVHLRLQSRAGRLSGDAAPDLNPPRNPRNLGRMPRFFPDFDSFAAKARDHDIVPVYRQLLADRVTPVTAFEVLGRDEHAFLLESVVGGERVGRHSFIATRPRGLYQCRAGKAVLWQQGQAMREFETADPLADLETFLGKHKLARDPKLPTFTGGLVGYAGYDLVRYYEGEKLSAPPVDDRGLPEVSFGLYEDLVVFDHVDKTLRVIANARVSNLSSEQLRAAYDEACHRIDLVVQRLQQPSNLALAEIDPDAATAFQASGNMTRQQYENIVAAGQEYIRAGDIFQFVPSLRMRLQSDAQPLDVYRALRVINPSPFMFFLKSPSCTLIGSSPEILCRVQDGEVTTRPLAGTRKRGKTPDEDAALEKDLLADPKELAEHVMLVDLHRNDIGRVCKIGSVRIHERMAIERYSHVMHISSDVRGQLADDQTAFDALKVSLPVGTVSGAPKIRAMQIIDELEPTRRGPYGGAVGYFDFAGNTDTCIALRTIVYRNGSYDVQAGAGVVADSVPASEYEECQNKAKALLRAVELASRGIDMR